MISTRCVDPADKLGFIDSSRIALVTEGELHAGYREKLGYGPADIAALELTPDNRAYQDHKISQAMRGSLLEAVAALTPCPWLYIDLGTHLLERPGRIEDDHPYADRLWMYSDPGFHEYMNELLARLEKFSHGVDEATKERALEAFKTSARYEWMFWQRAWEHQEWGG